MRPGPLPYDKRKLHPTFRATVLEAMRVNHGLGWHLALVAGYAAQPQLSDVLHARRVSVTPLTVARLSKLAELVAYVGDLFLDEVEQ